MDACDLMLRCPSGDASPSARREHEGSVGALLVSDPAGEAVRGVHVRVSGDAIHGDAIAGTAMAGGVSGPLVRVTAIRARPWSARLARWERATWEWHADGADASGCVQTLLPGVRLPHARHGTMRELRAVWVEALFAPLRAGRGGLVVEVSGLRADGGVRVERAVHVRGANDVDEFVLGAVWHGHEANTRARALEALDEVAEAMSAAWAPCDVLAVRANDRRRAHSRAGVAMAARGGFVGDGAWRQMRDAFAAGRVLALTLGPARNDVPRDAQLRAGAATRGRGDRAHTVAWVALGVARLTASERARGPAAWRDAIVGDHWRSADVHSADARVWSPEVLPALGVEPSVTATLTATSRATATLATNT